MPWGFYGRSDELAELDTVLRRRRWFFARVTGRRRIGKTTLVQRALAEAGRDKTFYVQIPDSAPAGVLSAVHDAMETFGVPPDKFDRPDSLLALARTIEAMCRAGYIVALDEFQYFSRKQLAEFTSHLQATVDRLSARADETPGGLIVLGSLHAELVALLEDRDAPLYNRTTDHLELTHLSIGSLLDLLDAHADRAPQRLLFLWNLFEGVPKFYRDAYEQSVLGADRSTVLERLFFRSSSPLRTEAENWFLSELRGRYDVVLKYVARNPGCSHGDIEAHARQISPTTGDRADGYLKILIERYQMLERRLPILAKPNARRGRYYVRDNFLRSWLAALHSPVSAINFRPLRDLLAQADERLAHAEGHALERLVASIYEERSRKGLGDFRLSRRIEGFWDKGDVEIDLVALNEDERIIRFGSMKRNGKRLPSDVSPFKGHVERFLNRYSSFRDWTIEYTSIAPTIDRDVRKYLEGVGVIPQDLTDLCRGL